MREGVIVTDSQQNVQLWNRSYIELTGLKENNQYTFQELLRPLLSLSPDQKNAELFFQSKKDIFVLNTPIHKINIRHETDDAAPGLNFWYFEIVTINHMADHLRRILLELPDLFLWKDKNMLVQGCNRNFATNNNMTPEQVIGRGYDGFNIDPETIELLKKVENDFILSGQKYLETEEILKENGNQRVILVTRTVLRNEDNEFEGMLIGYKDITNKKVLENELKLKSAQLQQSIQLAALGEMATGIAHEINNPLAIINSGVKCLERYLDEPEINREECKVLAKEITDTVMRVSKTISVLRSLSRQKLKAETEKLRLSDIFKDIRQLKYEFVKSRGIHFHIMPDENQDIVINAERSPFTQVLLHLIRNAVDGALLRGELEPWIRMSAEKNSDSIKIKVTDSGRGIPESIQESMFNPFFTTKEVGKGMGTGLSLSRSFVERINGQLYYSLEDGHTCFIIEIPLE